MSKLPIFIENKFNNGFYPDSENIPFAYLPWLGTNKLHHGDWINKYNNPLRKEYYFAFEHFFKRNVQTLKEATEIMHKLYQLIEVEKIKFSELGWVTHKKLYYEKVVQKSNDSRTKDTWEIKFIQFDFENITILNDIATAKETIENNNMNTNQLFAYDFEKGMMFPNLNCKAWA